MALPKTTQDRITSDAEDYSTKMIWINKNPKGEDQLFYEYISSTSYAAGATVGNERAQKLADTLEWIKTYGPLDDLAIKFIDKALNEWNGAATPNRPCPHCGKELSRDRNLCCRECGKEVEEPKQSVPQPDLDICKECKTRPAITDYNGHQYYVCKLCDDSLNREFDEEYR